MTRISEGTGSVRRPERTGNGRSRAVSGRTSARTLRRGTGTGTGTLRPVNGRSRRTETGRPTLTREDMENSVKIRHAGSFDYTFFFLVMFFFIFGLVMITSISAYNATKYYDDAFLFVKNQAEYGLIGLAAMLFLGVYIPRINYKVLMKKVTIKNFSFNPWIVGGYIICLGLQLAVLFVGHSNNGSARWFNLGSIRFQPSELTKLYFILFSAYMAQKNPKKLDKPIRFLKCLVILAPILYLVLKENLSTAIILACIFFGTFLIASRKSWYILGLGVVAGIGAVINITNTGYRSNRIDKWLNVETSADAYQILQGLYALVSGGFFGKGLGNSVQKLGYIPEVHTDMIFSCIVEELGIFGAVCLLALYGVLLGHILKISMHAKDLFGSLICVGVFIQLAVQIIINIAVVTNTMPATGIPLPLISYGGTALVFTMGGLGLVMNVSRQIVYEEEPA